MRISDWSSDVCSSDLNNLKAQQQQNDAALASQRNEFDLQAKREQAMLSESIARQKAEFEASLALRQQEFEEDMAERRFDFDQDMASRKAATVEASEMPRSEERRGGQECVRTGRSRWSPLH